MARELAQEVVRALANEPERGRVTVMAPQVASQAIVPGARGRAGVGRALGKVAAMGLALVIIVVALGLVVLATPARATEVNSHSITISSETTGHAFYAYQVLSGKVGADGVTLSDIEWGHGIDAEAALADLKLEETMTLTGIDFTEAETARDVAEAIDANLDSAVVDQLARVFARHLSGNKSGPSEEVAGEGGTTGNVISVAGDGYYLVQDEAETVVPGGARTKYILQVVEDTSVLSKASAPELHKFIDGDADTDDSTVGDVRFDNGSVGDVIPFRLVSRVPAMDGYDKYYFIVSDTMGAGLTFNDDVAVTIGGTALTPGVDFNVTVVSGGGAPDQEPSEADEEPSAGDSANDDTTGGQMSGSQPVGEATEFKIVFADFIQYRDRHVGDEIVITYSGTLNEAAVLGSVGNPNEAHLTYSNNPNVSDEGVDEPADESLVGNTPVERTVTYSTALRIAKVDGTSGEALAGAEFRVAGDRLNVTRVTGQRYIASGSVSVDDLVDASADQDDVTGSDDRGVAAAGTYYHLIDGTRGGTYTTTAPTDATMDSFERDESGAFVTYALVQVDEWFHTREGFEARAFVDPDGVLTLEGLGAGTYSIEELSAPSGYNALAEPVTVTIGWAGPSEAGSGDVCAWTQEGASGVVDGIVTVTVENRSGTILPATGGAGTVALYAIGGGLLLFVIISVIVRARRDTRPGARDD